MADFTFIDLVAPGVAERNHGEGFNEIFGNPLMNASGTVTVDHIIMASVAALIIVVMGLIARRKYANKEEAMIPDGKLTVRNFFEVIFDATLGLMSEMMGKKNAKRYFPLIAALAVYILISNLMGLIPGLAPPTQNLNTTLACSVVVFVMYNIAGIQEHGLGYLKHFLGPIWFIAPLMLVIELIGHAFRPISLGVRLTGNMTGDHMVLGVFGDLAAGLMSVPFLLPVPFLFLGLLVSIIQTLVFCLLSSIYISLAVSHEGH
jgi:F-type H+-transporting ATPase subunit a